MDRISVFISYSTHDKKIGGRFKCCLESYCGFHAFIAHDDIPPSTIFEEEIKNAINKCDIFIPLISQVFKDSDFTDQETGIAVSLNKKIIPIKLENLNPYGFMSKYQAMKYEKPRTQYSNIDNVKKLVLAIAQIGLNYEQLQIKTTDSIIHAFCKTSNPRG